jgi:hypothetical protein
LRSWKLGDLNEITIECSTVFDQHPSQNTGALQISIDGDMTNFNNGDDSAAEMDFVTTVDNPSEGNDGVDERIEMDQGRQPASASSCQLPAQDLDREHYQRPKDDDYHGQNQQVQDEVTHMNESSHCPRRCHRDLQLRRVVMERYDEETRSFEPQPTTVLTIRKTNSKIKSLMIFLVTVCPFIMIDEWMLLPVGVLLYSVAFQLAWENWTDEVEFSKQQEQGADRMKEWLRLQRKRHRSLQEAVDRAKFEIHILQNRPRVPVIPRQSPDGTFEVFSL